jgi:hypothetical protein
MERNVGSADRWVRIVIGLAVVAAGFYYSSWWGALGLVPLATAGLGWCPAYVPFGISSCRLPR